MLEAGYVLLSLVMLSIIFRGYYLWKQRTSDSDKVPQIIIPIVLWIVYLFILTYSESLKSLELPPRFVLFLLLPLILLSILFYRMNKDNIAFKDLPLKWTSLFQSFRIVVETIILYTFYKGILPQMATFEGYNFDIIIGISALFVGLVLVKDIPKNRTLILSWNILGILMILFVVFMIGTSFYFPSIWGSDVPLASLDFVSFPYILLPGFLAPSAVFMHVVSIIQIRNQT